MCVCSKGLKKKTREKKKHLGLVSSFHLFRFQSDLSNCAYMVQFQWVNILFFTIILCFAMGDIGKN